MKILQSYNTRIAHKLVIALHYLLSNVKVDLPHPQATFHCISSVKGGNWVRGAQWLGCVQVTHTHHVPNKVGRLGTRQGEISDNYQAAYMGETSRNSNTINAVIYMNSDQVSRKNLIKMANTTTNKTSNFKTTRVVLGPLFSFCGKTRVLVA